MYAKIVIYNELNREKDAFFANELTTPRYASRTSASLSEGYSFIALRFGTYDVVLSLVTKPKLLLCDK